MHEVVFELYSFWNHASNQLSTHLDGGLILLLSDYLDGLPRVCPNPTYSQEHPLAIIFPLAGCMVAQQFWQVGRVGRPQAARASKPGKWEWQLPHTIRGKWEFYLEQGKIS